MKTFEMQKDNKGLLETRVDRFPPVLLQPFLLVKDWISKHIHKSLRAQEERPGHRIGHNWTNTHSS